jgi:hypothetical protein
MRTAISPVRRILAMVAFLNRQPTLDFGGGNRSLCPEADSRSLMIE